MRSPSTVNSPAVQRAGDRRLPGLIVLMATVVAIVTIVEVHRSHGDAHAVREGSDSTSGSLRRTVQGAAPGALQTIASKTTQHGGSSTSRKQRSHPKGHKLGHLGSSKLSKSVLAALDVLDRADAIDPQCHLEEHAEYLGETVIKWGQVHLQETLGDCCNACMLDPNCNVWVYCGHSSGCGAGRVHKECWLKHASSKALSESVGTGKEGCLWSSGTLVDPEEVQRGGSREAARLEALRRDRETALVFLDISIKGTAVGRLVIALFYKEAPLAAENFRQLCTGEKGRVPAGHTGAGGYYSFKGSAFYRIVDRFIDQSGVNTDSVYGGMFADDPGGLALKHDRPGLLSMANTGPHTNTAHFSILMAPAPHLDGLYVIFGEVVEGMGVARTINALARGKKDNTAGIEEQAIIMDCGQLRGPVTSVAASAPQLPP